MGKQQPSICRGGKTCIFLGFLVPGIPSSKNVPQVEGMRYPSWVSGEGWGLRIGTIQDKLRDMGSPYKWPKVHGQLVIKLITPLRSNSEPPVI